MANRMYDDPEGFQRDIAETLKAIQEKGEGASAEVNAFKQKYEIPAEMTKGADCAGCSTCVGCFYCGPSLAGSMHVGHSMYVWAFNG